MLSKHDQKMNYDQIKFLSSWTCEWKSSDEMGNRILSHPNQREVDLPWKGKNVSPLIDTQSSIKAIHKSIIDIMDIHNSIMYFSDSIIDVHNSVM